MENDYVALYPETYSSKISFLLWHFQVQMFFVHVE